MLQFNNNKALFSKELIESSLSRMPGGVHIVLTGTHPNGVPLIALGYRNSTKTTIFFIFHSDAGSTCPGKPCEIKYTDDYGNVCVCLVDCPYLVSHFFAGSNLVDKHNQVQQDELGLKKC